MKGWIFKYGGLSALILALAAGFLTPFFSHAITVGPVKLEFSVNPGDVIKGEIFVQNESNQAGTFYPDFEKFLENDGEKKFVAEESDLPTWFVLPENIQLGVSEQRRVQFEIKVPQNASPGGHYAVMWWSTAPPKSKQKPGEQVSIVTRAGILVYLRVSGDIKESAEFTSFIASSSQTVFQSLPIPFYLSVNNTGNVHLKPQGSVIVKNIFGSQIDSIDINPNGLNVLPQSRKTYTAEWKGEGVYFGPYRITADISYGESNQKISKTILIWVVPYNIILIVALVFVLVVFVVPFAIKRYNRWIIGKARAG